MHRTVSLEESEIDRVGHRLVACIVRMEMIVGGEAGQESAGVVLIAQNRVEVDYTVKRATVSDPLVNRFAGRLLSRPSDNPGYRRLHRALRWNRSA